MAIETLRFRQTGPSAMSAAQNSILPAFAVATAAVPTGLPALSKVSYLMFDSNDFPSAESVISCVKP